MVDSILDNWSMRNVLRNEIRIELSPQTTSEKLQIAIDEIKKIFKEKEQFALNATVFLTEITRLSALVISEFFTSTSLPIQELNKLKQDLNLSIKKALEQNAILPSVVTSIGINQEK